MAVKKAAEAEALVLASPGSDNLSISFLLVRTSLHSSVSSIALSSQTIVPRPSLDNLFNTTSTLSAGFVAWRVTVPGNSAERKDQPRFRPSPGKAGARSRHRTVTGRIQCSGHRSPGLTLSHLTVRLLTLASRRGDSMSGGRLRDPEGLLDRRCPQPSTSAFRCPRSRRDGPGPDRPLTCVPDRSAEIAAPC